MNVSSTLLSLDELVEYIELLHTSNIVNDDQQFSGIKKNPDKYIPLDSGSIESIHETLPQNITQVISPVTDNLYRYGLTGIYTSKKNTYNISLYNSILTCLKQNFMQILENQKIIYIFKFVDAMCEDLDKQLYEKQLYNKRYREDMKSKNLDISIEELYDMRSLRKSHKQLILNIKQFCNTSDVLLELSKYFSINIYILDIDTDEIQVVYNGDKLDRYRESIILSHVSNYYEPIFHENLSRLNPSNNVIQHLISYNKINLKVINSNQSLDKEDKEDKELEIGVENLDKYKKELIIKSDNEDIQNEDIQNEYTETLDDINLGDKCVKNNGLNEDNTGLTITDVDDYTEADDTCESDSDSENQSTGLFRKIKNKSVTSTPICDTTIPISIKMKLSQLQEVAEKHNIITEKGKTKTGKPKLKTKAELYEEIVERIGL